MQKNIHCDTSGSNLSPFHQTPTIETNNRERIQLSTSALSDTDAVLHRYQTENSGIKYSGYLLKRSNRPYLLSKKTVIPASHGTTSSTSDSHNNFSKSIFSSSIQLPRLEKSQRGESNDNNVKPSSPQLSLAESDIDTRHRNAKTKSHGLLTPTKSKPIVINGSSSTRGSNDQIPTYGSSNGKHKHCIKVYDDNGYIEETFPNTCTKNPINNDSTIPPDYHDPKDGHIWRSKYCVLENGVLYFYRDAEDGNSIEAQEERDQAFSSNVNNNVKYIPSSGVTKSVLNNDVKSDGCLEVDHLAQSPTPRSYLRTVPTTKDTTVDLRSSHIPDPNSVMWEKRVALDRVGSVLASEADFGKHSFVLLGIDSNDDYHDIDKNTTKNSPVKENDEKTYDNIAAMTGDRLILRAASVDEMGNWIFEIHRSLQTLVNKIVRNRVSGGKRNCVFPYSSSEGHRPYMGFGSNNFIKRYTEPTTPPTIIHSSFSLGGFPLTDPSQISHGHSRSRLQQNLSENECKISVPSVIHGKGSLLAPPPDTKRKIVFSGSASYLTGASNRNICDNSSTLLEPIHKTKHRELEPSGIKCKERASNLTQALNMPNLTRKYIPPHRRKKEEGKKETDETLPIERIFRDKPDTENDPPPTLQPRSNNMERLLSEDFNILHSNIRKNDSGLQTSQKHVDPDGIINSCRKLGGCADPTLIKGSICDQMYIEKKASVLHNVDSEPYGALGGRPSSGKADKNNNVRWEVGAVSKCGIRSSNEDAYLVLNDLLDDVAIKDGSSSFFKSYECKGIFAIFDGHCGNHAARFAAEKFPSILLDESTKDDLTENAKQMSDEENIRHLLKKALIRLDREFCEMCTANGRNWDSGATALITMVIGDKLVVAGLGDSNGILSCTLSQGSWNEDNGWSKLEDYESKGCNVNHGSHIVWKEVVRIHSPSRADERRRIEEANGWITTETEISCSQIHRVNWDDYDVIDIVGRSIGNGKAEVGRILSISRVCGDLAVSRALGDKDYKAAYNSRHSEPVMDEDNSAIEWESPLINDRRFKGDLISSIPEINVHSLLHLMDEFLLLACDGLWDVMDSIDAVRITRNLLFQKGFSAKESANRLAELAKGLGSSDNITVIVVLFHAEDKK